MSIAAALSSAPFKLEGDFTSWSLLKKLDSPGSSSDNIAIAYVDSGETFVIILNAAVADPNRLVKWDLSANSQSVLASVTVPTIPTGRRISVLRTYLAHIDDATSSQVLVDKAGSLQDTLAYGDYGGLSDSLIDGVSITPDGKYILICFVDNGGVDLHWSLMKGG